MYLWNKLFVIIAFLCILDFVCCFNVNFRWNYDGIEIPPFDGDINKRDIGQFFDKAAYTFNGLEKIESVPVLFPLDICLMSLEGVKYATALHKSKDGIRHFAVFIMGNDGEYETLIDMPTPIAVAMDCRAVGSKGYAALAFNITQPIEFALDGSPIFEISGRRVRAIQYFTSRDMRAMYLRVTGNDFMLLQTFHNTQATPNLRCPFFLWSGTSFNKIGYIPCSNAKHLEPFSIDFENYVAVANYADKRGRTATNSEIYKLIPEKRKFQLIQKIRTNGAVDVRQFSVPVDELRQQHFLVFGNSIGGDGGPSRGTSSTNLEADSVFYVFDRGQFVPYQSLSFYNVEQFLPVQNTDAEKFLLLVASTNQVIKIYNLNDWKFEESKIQFTEGALSRGVSKMRIYQNNDTSYLVIANELMSAQETNVFLPIFERDEKANTLRRQIIDWTKTNIERLQQIDVDTLAKNAEAKLMQQQRNNEKRTFDIKEILNPNIQTVITKSLNYPQLKMNAKYWQALDFANQALDALQTSLTSPNQPQRPKRSIGSYDYEELNVNTLTIHKNLTAHKINGIENAHIERGYTKFATVKAPQVIVRNEYQERLRVSNITVKNKAKGAPRLISINSDIIDIKELHITGTLNGLTLDNLVNDTIKKNGPQVFCAPISIDRLQTDAIKVNSNMVNHRDLADLVRIDQNDIYYLPDLEFTSPVHANNIQVLHRLNNIKIGKNKNLEVLLRNSSETQIIEGTKTFDNLRILEPITMSGRMDGSHLQIISPKRVIHDDITVQGDFWISGNVTVEELLHTHDIVDEIANISTNKVLTNGVDLNEKLNNLNLHLNEPVEVNNSIVSFINSQDIQNLIKLNFNDIQLIQGQKIFQNGLNFTDGFSEVRTLNGIDMETLPERLLLKQTNQTIKVPLHVGKVITQSVQADTLTFNGTDMAEYLTRSGNQTIRGRPIFKRLKMKSFNASNVKTNGDIFGHSFNNIYQRKRKHAPRQEDLLQMDTKTFLGTMDVTHLHMPINTTLNGRLISEIIKQLATLNGLFKFMGQIQLLGAVNVSQLNFSGRLNNIPASQFARVWLQRNGTQDFRAPQTVTQINIGSATVNGSDIILSGRLNQMQLQDFYTDVLWTNRMEYVAEASFRDPIELQSNLYTTTLNGLRLPEDMLYLSTSQLQVVHDMIIFDGNFDIESTPQYMKSPTQKGWSNPWNTTLVNGIPYDMLGNFINKRNSEIPAKDTLFVQGIRFEQFPQFRTLNGYDLRTTLDKVWLANENIDLPRAIEIQEGNFHGLTELLNDGLINDVHLPYLIANFVSLTQPIQQILKEIHFAQAVNLESDFTTSNLDLHGPIMEPLKKNAIDFNHFVTHTVKIAGPHTVTGDWHIGEAHVSGSMHNVHLNELNLSKDVLLRQQEHHANELHRITAAKRVQMAKIKTLYTFPKSTIEGILINDWLQKTVFLNGNQTIEGTITLDNANIMSDLHVHGLVNNKTFNTNTILLRHSDSVQRIHGDVSITTKRSSEKHERNLAMIVDKLETDNINGYNMSAFVQQQINLSPELNMAKHLVFQQPLIVEKYQNGVTIDDRLKKKRNTYTEVNEFRGIQPHTKQFVNSVLHHFEVIQTLPVEAVNLIPLTLRVRNEFHDIVGVQLGNTPNLQYYVWNIETNMYERNTDFDKWLPQEYSYLMIWQVLFANAVYLSVESQRGNSRTPEEPNIRQVLSHSAIADIEKVLQPTRYELLNIQLHKEECIALVDRDGPSQQLPIYCLVAKEHKINGSDINKTTDNIPLQFLKRNSLQMDKLKKAVVLNSTMLALLLPERVEVWSTSGYEPVLLQRLSLEHKSQELISTVHGEFIYIAALTTSFQSAYPKSGMPAESCIEIYRSHSMSGKPIQFQHLQTLDFGTSRYPLPFSLTFYSIYKTDDLLLMSLTRDSRHPLMVYKYCGVEGFLPIVKNSVLPLATKLQVWELKVADRAHVALFGGNNCTIVEIVSEHL